jgi:hypothetical protein
LEADEGQSWAISEAYKGWPPEKVVHSEITLEQFKAPASSLEEEAVKPIVIRENFWIYVGVVAGFCYALMYYSMR